MGLLWLSTAESELTDKWIDSPETGRGGRATPVGRNFRRQQELIMSWAGLGGHGFLCARDWDSGLFGTGNEPPGVMRR